MKKILAIFDMDGTILDTLDDLTDSINYSLKTNQFPTRTKDEVRRFVGNGLLKLAERSVPENSSQEDIERVYHTLIPWYQKHCQDKTAPYPGIWELMENIHSAGMKIAVVSNKADAAVQELCRRYFDGLIDFAAGEREGIRKKPAPDSVLTAMEALHTKSDLAVYIGDSEVDIMTAKNAGIDCLTVTWGFRDREFLIEKGATTFADTAKELEKLLL